MTTRYQKFLPYLIWLLGAAFFLVDYVLRVAPSVLTPTLMREFNVNALAVGGFSGFFYYSYISMQIPVGILVDRFGPRRLLIMSTLVCALSAFMFASMHNLIFGYLSRFILGFGAAFAFVGTLKLISLWFKEAHFALLAGITQALGMIGATLGQGPMATVYQVFGWRAGMYGLAIFFVVLSLLIAIFVRDKNHNINHHDIGSHHDVKVWASINKVIRNSQTWLNCFYIGLLYAPGACFGEQWGASFLSVSQNISINAAGHETGFWFIGLAIGCPVLGLISDRIKRRLVVMRTCVLACLLLLGIVVYGNYLPFHQYLNPSLYIFVLLLFGFFTAGIVPSYALASEINPRQLTGMALGLTNMMSVVIGAIMIPVVGFILDTCWDGTVVNGVHVFAIVDYQIAFSALPLGLILAFIISLFQKETHCKHITHLIQP